MKEMKNTNTSKESKQEIFYCQIHFTHNCTS